MNFYVGQKVVCVDDKGCSIRAGSTYVIADIGVCCFPTYLVLMGIDEGCQMRCVGCGRDTGRHAFKPYRFRPIDDLTASLALAESERQVEERPDHINVPQHA